MSVSAIISGAILKGTRVVVSMPPRLIQSNTVVQVNSGSCTFTLTTPPTAGNLIVVNCGSTTGARTFAAPVSDGWSSSIVSATVGGSQAVFWKIAGGSESNAYVFTCNGTPDWSGAISELVDFNSASPIQFAVTNNSAAASVKTLNAVSTSQDVAANTLVLSALNGNGALGTAPDPSNNFDLIVEGTPFRLSLRRYFVAQAAQNSTWTWATSRAANTTFVGINPRS